MPTVTASKVLAPNRVMVVMGIRNLCVMRSMVNWWVYPTTRQGYHNAPTLTAMTSMASTDLLINGLVYQYLAEIFTRAFGLWIFEKRYWLVGFYDSSFIHEHDPIGNLLGEPFFVRDTNHRHATFGQVDQNITDADETKYDIYAPGLSE